MIKKFLYIGTIVTMFDPRKIRKGNTRGQDDGLELAISGQTPKGKSTTFVIRLFAGNVLQCFETDETLNNIDKQLEKEIHYSSVIKSQKRSGHGWYSEIAIPLHAVGLNPKPELKVPFNLSVWSNEYGHRHYWEGTQGENWDLKQAGSLLFE